MHARARVCVAADANGRGGSLVSRLANTKEPSHTGSCRPSPACLPARHVHTSFARLLLLTAAAGQGVPAAERSCHSFTHWTRLFHSPISLAHFLRSFHSFCSWSRPRRSCVLLGWRCPATTRGRLPLPPPPPRTMIVAPQTAVAAMRSKKAGRRAGGGGRGRAGMRAAAAAKSAAGRRGAASGGRKSGRRQSTQSTRSGATGTEPLWMAGSSTWYGPGCAVLRPVVIACRR